MQKREPWLPRILASKDYGRVVLLVRDREKFTLQFICDEFGFSERKVLVIMAAMLKSGRIEKIKDLGSMTLSVWKYIPEPSKTVPKKKSPTKRDQRLNNWINDTVPAVPEKTSDLSAVLEKIDKLKNAGTTRTIFVVGNRVFSTDVEFSDGTMMLDVANGKVLEVKSVETWNRSMIDPGSSRGYISSSGKIYHLKEN